MLNALMAACPKGITASIAYKRLAEDATSVRVSAAADADENTFILRIVKAFVTAYVNVDVERYS
jgi:hypothetical protein